MRKVSLINPIHRRYGSIQVRPTVDSEGNVQHVGYYRQVYTHTARFNFTTKGQELIVVVNMLNDADFELQEIMSTHTNIDYEYSLLDATPGLLLQDGSQTATNTTGTGQRPYILPTTYILNRSGNLQVTAKNGQAVDVNTVVMAFVGARLFETETIDLPSQP